MPKKRGRKPLFDERLQKMTLALPVHILPWLDRRGGSTYVRDLLVELFELEKAFGCAHASWGTGIIKEDS